MRRTSRLHPRVIFSRLKTKFPFFVWLLAIAAVAVLSMLGGKGNTMPGMVERSTLHVGSTLSGTVQEILVAPGQLIQAGDVVARMDSRSLQDQQAKAAYDLRLQALNVDRTYTEFAFDAATKRDEKTLDLRQTKSELASIDEQLATLNLLVDQGLLEPQSTASFQIRRDTLAKTIDLYPATFANLDQQILWANDQKQRLTNAILSPEDFFGDTNIVTQIDLIQGQIEQCIIRSPVDGTIATVLVPSGQHVEAGQAILSLVLTNNSTLVAFLDQTSPLVPFVGEDWLVRAANTTADTGYYRARVESLAPDIVEVEARMSMLPTQVPRGRYVRLTLLEPAPFLPGQSVTLLSKKPAWHDVSEWILKRVKSRSPEKAVAILKREDQEG